MQFAVLKVSSSTRFRKQSVENCFSDCLMLSVRCWRDLFFKADKEFAKVKIQLCNSRFSILFPPNSLRIRDELRILSSALSQFKGHWLWEQGSWRIFKRLPTLFCFSSAFQSLLSKNYEFRRILRHALITLFETLKCSINL